MATDAYGLPATTASAEARARYDRGVRELLGWGRDALPAFRAAVALDAGLALAHAGAAVCLFLDERFAEARAAAEAARAAVAGQSARERSHVAALGLLVTGQTVEAERAMLAHLDAWPRDAVVLQRLYFIWFWQGRFPEMLAVTTRLLPAYGDDSFVLGLHAFGLEEAGRCAEAVRAAETAVERNPEDAWAVHALAHALYELAAFDEGIARLPAMIHPCRRLNWFRNHLVWHLALLHLSRGDYARAVRMSRAAFERAPSAVAGDLHDSIALLWRQDLFGLPVGARWRPFAAIARERLGRQGLLFHAAHLAMALAGAGDWATAETQLDMLRQRAPRDRTGLVGAVLIPLVEGLHAFARGEPAAAIARLEPLRARIVELGGSRAQRDVFHDTLLEACFRAGDGERAERLLAERVARRPDHYWTRRRPGSDPTCRV
jgi:tetratricopeptide (TPR) repeat protein